MLCDQRSVTVLFFLVNFKTLAVSEVVAKLPTIRRPTSRLVIAIIITITIITITFIIISSFLSTAVPLLSPDLVLPACNKLLQEAKYITHERYHKLPTDRANIPSGKRF